MHVIIAGNIGVGKSSLTARLANAFGWLPFFETADENPYLADFYADMPRWGFHSQLFFLSRRVQAQMALIGSLQHDRRSVVQDRSLYEDAEIFAENLYQQGVLDVRDYATYRALYQGMCALLPPPDLLIYLRADVPTLLSRIALRGRTFEQGIAPQYLTSLNGLYEEWITHWDRSPVLTIPTDALDFVHKPYDLNTVIGLISSARELQAS